ncbi:hypothetical protein C1646_677371 [Rhizophagus diaphanus]|nr:hypothetical protein C1646_677371 [Rhizophagus diaphanus] [Rhizophagus sp. MUCL 43196]
MDLLIALTTIPNLFYPMQNDKLLNSGGLCEGIGFSISLFIVMNMSLMAVIAVVTYLRVCMRRVVSLGNYDWILGAIILVPSSLISILTIVTYGYGEDNYWCFMNRIDYQNVIKRIHGVETMLTSPVFKSIRKRRNISSSVPLRDISRRKFSTASSLRSSPSMLSSKSSYTSQNTSDGLELRPPSFFMNTLSQYRNSSTNSNIPTIEQLKIASNITRATRKMASYIFLQLMQYTPFIIYCLCFLFDIIQSWVYILFIVLINLGGVAKSLAFLRNEIFFKQKNDSNYSGNSSGTTRHSRNSSNNSINPPPKSYPSKKSHRLNPSLSSTISNYSSHSNNNNNNNNNIGMMSTIVENDLPSLPSSPTRANTDLTLVDKNDSYITKDRNTSIYKNNDINNDDNIIEVVDDDLEGSESSEYEWCEDDMIDIDFLVPFIFSDQSIITTPPPALTFSSETRKIFNRNLRESSLLNINTPSNIESSTFNNSYCNSFISYNESIPDPYFHNNGDNSSIS